MGVFGMQLEGGLTFFPEETHPGMAAREVQLSCKPVVIPGRMRSRFPERDAETEQRRGITQSARSQ